MSDLIHRLSRLEVRDWVAIYAAVLSTVTATVQVINARRDRPRLRVKIWRDSPKVRDGAKKYNFVVVKIANVGSKPVPIFRPQLQVAQHGTAISRIYYDSPNEEYDDYHYDWAEIEQQEPEQPFELKETEAQFYRFTVSTSAKVLALRIVDRAGVVRFRRRMFLSPLHRIVFWLKHSKLHPTRQPRDQRAA